MVMAAEAAVRWDDPTAGRYEALIRIANSIRACKTPEDLFRVLTHELSQVVPFDAIAQFDESSNKIRWHLGSVCRALKHSPEEINHGETLAEFVYREQIPVVLGSLDGEMRFPKSVAILREACLQSVCALPLTTAHRRLGSLVIASVKRDAYSPDEVRFCALVVDQVALAMDDAISFQESARAQERLQLLLDLTNRVVSNLNMKDVLREVCAEIRRAMHCDGAGVALPCPRDGKLRVYALDFPNAPGEIEEGFEPPANDAPLARAFRDGEAVILSREEIEALSIRTGMNSVVDVPMRGRDGIVGVLALGTRTEGVFGPGDLPFLTQIGRQVAIAIENARTFGEVTELKNKLAQENLYLEDEIRSELKFEEIVGRSGFHRADLWRNRFRQGIDRARGPQSQRAQGECVRQTQLRRHPYWPARKRAFRS
jgi:formate hydrogenlyase transcriptional activator